MRGSSRSARRHDILQPTNVLSTTSHTRGMNSQSQTWNQQAMLYGKTTGSLRSPPRHIRPRRRPWALAPSLGHPSHCKAGCTQRRRLVMGRSGETSNADSFACCADAMRTASSHGFFGTSDASNIDRASWKIAAQHSTASDSAAAHRFCVQPNVRAGSSQSDP